MCVCVYIFIYICVYVCVYLLHVSTNMSGFVVHILCVLLIYNRYGNGWGWPPAPPIN